MEWVPGVPQYLFDDALIATQQRLVRRWLPATVHPWPVIVPDRPWEGRMPVLYGTLLPRPTGRVLAVLWQLYARRRAGKGAAGRQ